MSLDRVKLIKNFFNGLQNNEETNFIGDLLLYLSDDMYIFEKPLDSTNIEVYGLVKINELTK